MNKIINTMNKKELIKYLDEYLRLSDFKDDSKNGLQIDCSKDEIKKIGYAVDANTYIFDRAVQEGVDMVISHHGLFWGHEQVLVGLPYKRAKIMIENDICSYACHLPLDAHPEVGNNIGLAKAFVNIFGLREGEYSIEPFCEYKGNTIGFGLRFDKTVYVSNLVTPFAEQMQLLKRLYNFGNKQYINSVAFVSGGALSEVAKVNDQNYDVFLTGEGAHHDMILAKELGQTVLIGGHYETEKIGPKLLAYHLRDKFGIEIVYLDEKY
ncbi:MAG: Nif3-like dinuclear metal center hexameric protein [Candidatus Gracilibacteria bacterium]|nr:Nif3-like dinuclear metal center hexameric protein [Candidatus Gracilibacteria bacterium]